MSEQLQPLSVQLDEVTVKLIDQMLGEHGGEDRASLIARLVRQEMQRFRHVSDDTLDEFDLELMRQWDEAAKDPLFQQDIREVERDFAAADLETWRAIR